DLFRTAVADRPAASHPGWAFPTRRWCLRARTSGPPTPSASAHRRCAAAPGPAPAPPASGGLPRPGGDALRPGPRPRPASYAPPPEPARRRARPPAPRPAAARPPTYTTFWRRSSPGELLIQFEGMADEIQQIQPRPHVADHRVPVRLL